MVMVKPLSLGFTITLLMAEAVVHRCFSKYVFLKNSFQTCNFIKKRFRYRFFPVKFAKFLRTSFLRTPPWFKVNHLIYCVQEKTPKIKRLIQYVKLYLLFVYSVITWINGYWKFWRIRNCRTYLESGLLF